MRLSKYIGAALVAAVVVAMGVAPWSAGAWELSKGTNGVVLMRESSDTTAAVAIDRFWNYKYGDADWVFSSSTDRLPNSYLAYNSSANVAQIQAGSLADAIEVQLQPGYRLQMVRVKLLDTPFTSLQTFAVVNDALGVRVSNDVTISAMPSTVSVDATLPVTVEGLAGIDGPGLLAGVGLVCFALGIVAYRGVTQ